MTRPAITLVNSSQSERATRKLLLELSERYGLERYLYTETVQIEEGVIPHSHPVLTLNTLPVKKDPPSPTYLLATYIHEQMHWFLTLETLYEPFYKAITRFRKDFLDLPVGGSEGCRSEFSNYLHIMVNWLEFDGLRTVLDEERALSEISQRSFYTRIYGLVLENDVYIRRTLEQLGLLLPQRQPEHKRFRQVEL